MAFLNRSERVRLDRSVQSVSRADRVAVIVSLRDESSSLFVCLRDQSFDRYNARADVFRLSAHVDQVPVVAAVLETGPVTVTADFIRGLVEQSRILKVDATAPG